MKTGFRTRSILQHRIEFWKLCSKFFGTQHFFCCCGLTALYCSRIERFRWLEKMSLFSYNSKGSAVEGKGQWHHPRCPAAMKGSFTIRSDPKIVLAHHPWLTIRFRLQSFYNHFEPVRSFSVRKDWNRARWHFSEIFSRLWPSCYSRCWHLQILPQHFNRSRKRRCKRSSIHISQGICSMTRE